MTENPIATAPRSPIQNLLDEVDDLALHVTVPHGDGIVVVRVFPEDEGKNHIKDLIRSAYATGIAKGGKGA